MRAMWIAGAAVLSGWVSVQTPPREAPRPGGAHAFALGDREFLLDGAPLRLISCELHPARIPVEYWPHRIRMARAMGCRMSRHASRRRRRSRLSIG